jgi:hypothetical protein
MSDQLVQETVEGEVAEQTTQPEAPTPSYLTREEAEQLMKNAVDEALNRQVGLYTKGTEKLRQRLQSLEEHLQLQKDAGVNIDPAAAERMRSQIISKSLMEDNEMPSQAQKADAQPPQRNDGVDPQLAQRVNSIAKNILQTMGVTFEQGAPELKMINMSGDYVEYLDSLTQAATAWKKRTSDKPNPEARIPGLVSGNTATSREDAINAELEKLYRNPQRNMARINTLTQELQSIVRK